MATKTASAEVAALANAKQAAQDRLTTAKDAEQAAKAALTALRERHKTTGSVSAQQFGDAAHAVELAELDRQGAEDAIAEAGRRERLEALAVLRAEIEAGARPERAAAAFKRAADAIGDLIAEIGPPRAKMVSGWIHRLRELGVEPVHGGEQPSPDDGGLAWSDVGFAGRPGAVLWVGDDGKKHAAHTAYDEVRILSCIVYRASRQTGTPGGIFGVAVAAADNSLIDDPDTWFQRNG